MAQWERAPGRRGRGRARGAGPGGGGSNERAPRPGPAGARDAAERLVANVTVCKPRGVVKGAGLGARCRPRGYVRRRVCPRAGAAGAQASGGGVGMAMGAGRPSGRRQRASSGGGSVAGARAARTPVRLAPKLGPWGAPTS